MHIMGTTAKKGRILFRQEHSNQPFYETGSLLAAVRIIRGIGNASYEVYESEGPNQPLTFLFRYERIRHYPEELMNGYDARKQKQAILT